MFGKKKHKVQIWSAITSIIVLVGCTESKTSTVEGISILGETQGTTYNVIIAESNPDVTKDQLDSLFLSFDNSLSTYVNTSVISKLNQSKDSIALYDKSHYFKDCYLVSQSIFEKTNGLFDPSVFPLVKGWGFMNNMDTPLSKESVDSILKFVNFEKQLLHDVRFSGDSIHFSKNHHSFMLDFNAIAQGQSVDVVDDFLASKGLKNYYIEIGGEIVVRGKNREGIDWRIGIDVPKENLEERELENILSVSNKAVATSGNYRKFYIKDGVKYAHSLNPKTGFPVHHSLLSATVIADDCATADGYATAFMVMGTEATLEFVNNNPDLNLEVYLLSADCEGGVVRSMSSGFESFIAE